MKKALTLFGFAMLVPASLSAQDFTLEFSSNGASDFRLLTVSSTEVFDGALPANDPDINLEIGSRYRIVNQVAIPHPFQIISKGASAGSDVALLSQGSGSGSLESDSGINFVDNSGDGSIEFTVTQTLINAMNENGNNPGYRCAIHVGSMRGDFIVGGAASPTPSPTVEPTATASPTISPTATTAPSPSPTVVSGPSSNPAVVFANLDDVQWTSNDLAPIFNEPTFTMTNGLGLYTSTGNDVAYGFWETTQSLDPLPAGLHKITLALDPDLPGAGERQPSLRFRLFTVDNSYSNLGVTAQAGAETLREEVEVYWVSDGTTQWKVAIDLLGTEAATTGGADITAISMESLSN